MNRKINRGNLRIHNRDRETHTSTSTNVIVDYSKCKLQINGGIILQTSLQIGYIFSQRQISFMLITDVA